MYIQHKLSEGKSASDALKPVFLCLHPSCKGSERLLCNENLEKTTHMGHRKVLVHELIQPFARLSNNKCSGTAKEIHKKLKSSFQAINKSVLNVERYFMDELYELRKNLLQTMETILGTYDNEMIQNAVNTCVSQVENRPEELDKIAKQILFLTKYESSSPEAEMAKFKAIEKDGLEVMEQGLESISKVMRNMKERFRQLKMKLTEKDEKRVFQERNEDLMMLQPKRLHERKERRERKQLPPPTSTPYSQPASFVSMNKIEEQNQIDVVVPAFPNFDSDISSSLPKLNISKSRSRHRKSNSKSRRKLAVKMEENVMLDEKDEKEDLALNLQQKQVRTLVINEKEDLNPYNEGEDVSTVNKLVIENVNNGIQSICKLLSRMTKLQEVSVYDIEVGSQSNIIEFMKALPTSIRRIYFCCANDFGINCINLLHSRKIYKITHLQYFFDVVRDLRRVDESLYFKEKNRGIRIEPIKFDQACQIVNYFPRIKNAWVPSKINTSGGRKIPLENLESLVIGELDQFPSRVELPKRVVSSLMKTRQLKSLSLLSVQLDDTILVQVLQNNCQLEALYLQCCHTITETAMEAISPERNITSFSIKDCYKIQGKFVEKLHKTKVFIMDYSEISLKQGMAGFQNFSGLDSLVYLNLYGNYHFRDQLLADLKNSSATLKSLNIGLTSITQECVSSFQYFPNLQCLCLDDNRLDMPAIISILEKTPKLHKLSLCGYSGENGRGQLTSEHLEVISHLVPELTHLSIKFCKKLSGKLNPQAFKKLKYVQFEGEDPEVLQALKQAGVDVSYDE